ncbi:GntR family transcriptional regulator / MocR family aminotransferase [Mucilaginibacter pineti]|uniref:GntR family transcriptional regulator / MocR family aminotransferase n=1 Tax=Mucilaginibacter pineti TaxID=1391627 RepID=A0A1G7NRC8_9SPHI|nr:PLP-dependent aminotransferase family protein [Mucilaginibacter pineti]SDF76536.1 GntR family transcriptional regulator / MocR family aminotransferase [Mucilaginibacter pineti]
MLPYQTLIIVEQKNGIPIYRQIANRLISLIQSGKILPASFLPGTREMAGIINVHRNTVIAAYNELVLQGWAEAIPKKGYRIIPDLPIIKPRSFHPEPNFIIAPEDDVSDYYDGTVAHSYQGAGIGESKIIVNDGFPDIDLAPYEEIMKEYRRFVQGGSLKRLMSIRYDGGTPSLRSSICTFLNQSRGLNVGPDSVLITRGAQMAIYLAISTLINPGDHMVVSNPSYFIADEIFRKKGAVLNRVGVDQDGIDVDQLEDILKDKPIKLLYIIPHHHHPTTVTMSAPRRIKLLNLIEKYRLWVIEDDYDYDFHYQNSPILPLASADHGGRIIYIGSFTKILAPSFRIGYMIGGKNIIRQASAYRRLIDLRGDTIMEGALSAMIDNGELNRHIKRCKKIYARRCDRAAELLKTELENIVDFQKPQGGMAIWLKFGLDYPLGKVMSRAAQQGLLLAGSAYFQGEHMTTNSVRFGFASLTDDELAEAVRILKRATRG